MNRIWHALIGVVLLTAAASALTIQSGTGQISLVAGRTSGELGLWFSNPYATSADYSASVSSSDLTATISPAFGTISPQGTQLLNLQVSAPSCARGTFYVTVNVEVRDSQGSVERGSKVIAANVRRGQECNAEIVGLATNDNFDSASSITFSSLSRAADFDPSEVNVALDSAAGIGNVAVGEFKQLKLTLTNRGVAGTYQLALVADPQLNAQLSAASITMSRNEVETVYLDVQPRSLQGRQWVEVQVLKEGVVVNQRSVYVDVANNYAGKLILPQLVRADNCGGKVIAGRVENVGSAADNFSVTAVNLGLATQSISVPARSSVPFVITADLSQVPAGNWELEFELRNSRGLADKKKVEFELLQCLTAVLNYTLTLANPTNSTYRGVVATVEGLPADWKIDSEFPVDIQPGENHTFTVLVHQHGDVAKEVVPVMVLRDANGKLLESKAMAPVKPASNLSGFFTLGGISLSNLQVIAVLLFVALVVAVLSARTSVNRYESI